MPEGHVIHRLAHMLDTTFSGTIPQVSSPQGRFNTEASLIDGCAYSHSEAWGKHLFIHFDSSQIENIVYIHLGLIGSLRFEPRDETWGQIRFRIAISDTAANLRGPQWCRLVTEADMQQAISRLGADPLRDDANPEVIKQKIARSQRSIASLLMDQKLFAGVGNIYRAETLFRLGINPFITGKSLGQFDDIWQDLVFLMNEGVRVGKIDTVRPEHTPQAMGRDPRKDDHGGEVYVYRRANQPCYICGTPILEQTYEGRNLFWCPTCQPG
ncbi:putative DNA repair glycosylase [Corynebacterium kutscheri]|uniref:DNA-(apurinic or apyrimidinic site) lyase n=1 Tax=Corynebacterium kutscheri TaxID=35755 RepID=A0A0F6TE30_9CORY|nr:DNA-formamidopyrimidine glycosylase family protein [Corynebacterium kutscheri]AKE42204.1 formamidopyrimidine-DNA glycosylase [Corynebacterium kutscheri]VEH05766.1 putative DNA repair glycosylase [Corynebacterium kutscheri]VEH10547.1 putative DNA repair glycosylase [Corynebacterium kutscheri]VEH81661.1 putative DNA repair glycosylase [Corynebacterium kutscheri]